MDEAESRMDEPGREAIVAALLARYGQTFARELGIPVAKNTPAPLFQLLCAALLFSAPIAAKSAAQAARALLDAGLTTPQKMAAASWQERVDVITWHGYKRYDERTSTMLGRAAERVLARYHGDLRRLRDAAGRDVSREKELLMEFSGIGRVGADIFLREVQIVWDEVYPYADERVMKAAGRLGLGGTPRELSALVSRAQFVDLVAALLRVDLYKAYDEIGQIARRHLT